MISISRLQPLLPTELAVAVAAIGVASPAEPCYDVAIRDRLRAVASLEDMLVFLFVIARFFRQLKHPTSTARFVSHRRSAST